MARFARSTAAEKMGTRGERRMKSEGVVISTDGRYAIVATERRAACEGCHKRGEGGECSVCSLLGGESRLDTRALNRVGARVGDTVELESSSGRMLWYAALVFLLPCVLGILAYMAAGALTQSEAVRSLCAVGGFALGLIGAALYSRFVAGARVDVVVSAVIASGTADDESYESQASDI